MRRLILILLLGLVFNESFACLHASQNRIFPIGMSSKGLVVVEVHLTRGDSTDGKTEKLHAIWGGISHLNIYDKNYKLVESKLIDTLKRFNEKSYLDIINKTFNKGIELSKKINSLVYVEPQNISFCDYQLRCEKARLQIDTISNSAFVLLEYKKKQEITVLDDSSGMVSNYLNFYNGFDYESTESKKKAIIEGLLINSVREYKIGNLKLTMIHLGSGQSFNPEGYLTKEYKPDFPFATLENSVFREPVLHHGHGFDFFILD